MESQAVFLHLTTQSMSIELSSPESHSRGFVSYILQLIGLDSPKSQIPTPTHPRARPRDMPEPLAVLPLVPRTDGMPPLPLVVLPLAEPTPLVALAAAPPLVVRDGVTPAVGFVNLLAGLVDAGGFSTKLVSVVLQKKKVSHPIVQIHHTSPSSIILFALRLTKT